MEIRVRHDDDLNDLVSLAARVHEADNYPIYLPDGNYRRFLTEPRPMTAWVALDGNELLGHVALNETTSPPVMRLVDELKPHSPAAYVARLLVDPLSRRKGIGRTLLDHARRAATDVSHSAFLDVVDTATARPAIALYRRSGWKEVGRATFKLVDEHVDELVFRGPAH